MTDFVDLYSRDYNGTFVGVKNSDGIVRPFYVDSVDARRSNSDEASVRMRGTLHTPSGSEDFTILVLDPNLQLNHVDLGMIQMGNKVAYIKRRPRRQWRRGFRMNNCGRPATHCNFRADGNAFYVAVFNPTYKTLDEALRSIRRSSRSGQGVGYALSQDFAVVRSTENCSLPMIQYRDTLIGFIDNDNDLNIRPQFDTAMIRKMLNKIYTKGVFKHASTN